MTKNLINEFKDSMQKVANDGDLTISIIKSDGEETIIAQPETKEENEVPAPAPSRKKDGKYNFTKPINLVCGADDLRPAMQCIHFANGYMYASNGMMIIKQSMEYHTIINPENLEGKSIHKDSFKQIMSFQMAEAEQDFILCKDENLREAKFFYTNCKDVPKFESVIPKGATSAVEFIGVNPEFVGIAGKVLHGSDRGIKIDFNGYNKGMLITTMEYADQVFLLMPVLLEPTLF